MNGKHLILKTLLAGLILICTATAQAQFVRTSYFMDGATNKLQLNPALRPQRGYVNIPAAGAIYAGTSSNTLGVGDIINMIETDGEDYKLKDDLFGRLEKGNWFNATLNTDIISFGFYKGKGFWSGSIGLRTDIGGSFPKAKFEYMKYMNEWYKTNFEDAPSPAHGIRNFDIRNESVNINAYTEVGVGYSRQLNEKLTVGAKAKLLLGIANLNLDIKRMSVEENFYTESYNHEGEHYEYEDFITKVDRDIHMEVSMAGFGITTAYDEEDNEETIEDLEFDEFGFAGYGFGLDLGATYQVMDNFIVSASLIDLGFISWKKGSTHIASNNQSSTYDYQLEGGTFLDFDVMRLSMEEQKSRKTSLATTLVLGAEYGFLNNMLSAGVLSTTRFGKPKTISEITFSGNYRPKSWLDVSLSYSVFQSDFKTVGLALRMGPVFIGTDYMYIGEDTKSMNAYLGVSIPLGKKRI